MEAKTKSEVTKRERVALKEQCLERMRIWADQLGHHFKGVKVKPADIVEWQLLARPERLTANDVADFQRQYWDDVAFTAWALKRLKAARSKGEQLSLAEVIGVTKQGGTDIRRDRRTDAKVKNTQHVSIEVLKVSADGGPKGDA